MESWKELISEELKNQNESWDDVVSSTLSEDELNKEFSADYGRAEGCPFTLWTHNRVYFPVDYDGSEWVNSVPRNPCDEKSPHAGGE